MNLKEFNLNLSIRNNELFYIYESNVDKKLIIYIEFLPHYRSIDGTQTVLLWNFPSLSI